MSAALTKGNSSSGSTTTLTSTSHLYGPSQVFLATAMVRVFDKFNCPVVGRALLDSGSQLSLISQAFAAKLQLPLKKVSAEIGGIGSSVVQASSSTWIQLQSMVSNYCMEVEVLVLPSITSITPSMPINTSTWHIPSNLRLADPTFARSHTIDMLLGAELYFELLKVGQVKLGNNLPHLQNTVFGWIIAGRYSTNASSSSQRQVTLLTSSVATIDDEIEKFWKLEEIAEDSKVFPAKEHPCEKHFVERFTRNEDGRFSVRLPFIRRPSSLGDSSKVALRRFYNLEKRLCEDQQLHSAYKAFLDEYRTLGHMKLISSDSIPASNYYLPHHCVLKPDSSTTKLSVVFDGSAKTSNQLSLNDILMVGPVVQNDLVAVLCRFRSHKYAFSTDISKMYRQICVHPEDSNYQLIYWRDDPHEILRSYRLTTVTYGTSAAPFLATRCLLQCALDNQKTQSAACDAIRYDMYVDDMLTGGNSLPETNQLKHDIIKVLSTCGMKLGKWCANNPDIIADIPPENREQLLHFGDDNYIKTLGIFWQPQRDVLQFRVPCLNQTKLTKRLVISEIARLFDPLGLVSPVVVLGKIFMQKLWQQKLDWDEALPMNHHTYWQTFRTNLKELNQLSIKRHLFGDIVPSGLIELHGFADASEVAYGAAIYTRCAQPNGRFLVQLLCSKSRVAPLQKTTLPRLELCAALLLAQLVSQVRATVNFMISDTFYWTDSTIVLHWLNTPPSNLKTFVANRVSTIQELTRPQSWHHIDSKQNPADVASRGMMPTALINCNLWFSGPLILQRSDSPWLIPNIPFNMPSSIAPEDYEYKGATTLVATTSTGTSYFTNMLTTIIE